MGNRLSVTLISSLATEEERVSAPAKPASLAKPEPVPPVSTPAPALVFEAVAPPAPPIWEEPEEPAVLAAETAVFADELIQVEEPAAELAPEPVPTAEKPGGRTGSGRSAPLSAARDFAAEEADDMFSRNRNRSKRKRCTRNKRCCNSSRLRAVGLRKASRQSWKARISMSRHFSARTSG